MRILIIRHGEPDYENDNLTEKGKLEAELLAKGLLQSGFRKYIPLRRIARNDMP